MQSATDRLQYYRVESDPPSCHRFFAVARRETKEAPGAGEATVEVEIFILADGGTWFERVEVTMPAGAGGRFGDGYEDRATQEIVRARVQEYLDKTGGWAAQRAPGPALRAEQTDFFRAVALGRFAVKGLHAMQLHPIADISGLASDAHFAGKIRVEIRPDADME
jgi:hypothetical protein